MYDEPDLKNVPMNFEIDVNNVFRSKEVFQTAIGMTAVRNNFEFKVFRSSKTRYCIGCANDMCSWKMNASVCKNSGLWVIGSYVKEHTCYGQSIIHKNKHASSVLISKCVKDDFRGPLANQITPSGVAEIMRSRFNVEVTYYRAWKGRKESLRDLRGDFEESYSHLPLVGEMIREKNPGIYFVSSY